MSCTDSVYDERICHMEAVPFVSDIAQFRAAVSGFAGIFSDVLEYDEDHDGDSAWAGSVWYAFSMGAGTLSFYREKVHLSALYSSYDASVSGNDAFGISGT